MSDSPLIIQPLLYLESSAGKGGVGKTTMANCLRDYCLEAGHPVVTIRIDSRRALLDVTPGEIVIYSEDFAGAADRIGGVSGVLAPIWEALEDAKRTGSVVIIDWGAGLTEHRFSMMAATGFDRLLAASGIQG